MKLVEVSVDSIFGGPNVHNPNEINPYSGCMFHCSYCYVDGNEDAQQEKLFIKMNAPELVDRDIESLDPRIAIFLSSQTDPYLYAEQKYRLTRGCIEQVVKHRPYTLSILTKSDLVMRDIDLLKQVDSEVQFSLAILDEQVRKVIEPFAPPVKDRLRAIDELERNGIPTSVRIKPILPFGFTPVREIVELVANRTTHPIVIQDLGVAPVYMERMAKLAEEHFPDRYRWWMENGEAIRREREELTDYVRNHPRIDFQDAQELLSQIRLLEQEGVEFEVS